MEWARAVDTYHPHGRDDRDFQDAPCVQPIHRARATCGMVHARPTTLYPGPLDTTPRHSCQRPRCGRSRRRAGALEHRRGQMIAFSLLLAAGALLLLLPLLSDLLSLAGLALGRHTASAGAGGSPRPLFLVPAPTA